MSAVNNPVVGEFTGSAAEWDAFVEQQPGWTHYHRAGWRDVMKRAVGFDSVHLAARDESGALVGVLPLVRVRTLLFGRHLVSMPFLNYGGPLGSEAAVRALTTEAQTRAGRARAKQLEFRSRSPLPIDLPCSTHKVTAILDLAPGNPEQTWKALPSRIRNAVRKPIKRGVTMRFGPDQVKPFFEVFARNMRDLGTPAHSLSLFEEMVAVFPNDVWFGCAYVDERPVSCGCGVVWGKELELVWGSSLREYNASHAPNMLMYWSFMERAAQHGLERFNFGRCTRGSTTHHFKLQWGAREEQLWWYNQGRSAAAVASTGGDSALSFGPRVWKRLPLSVATGIGPYIRRGIPA